MQRKETPEEALRRTILEGKRINSVSGRLFPHLLNGISVPIARRPQQPTRPTAGSVLYPHLKTENK